MSIEYKTYNLPEESEIDLLKYKIEMLENKVISLQVDTDNLKEIIKVNNLSDYTTMHKLKNLIDSEGLIQCAIDEHFNFKEFMRETKEYLREKYPEDNI